LNLLNPLNLLNLLNPTTCGQTVRRRWRLEMALQAMELGQPPRVAAG
jgi:hypothetical protein